MAARVPHPSIISCNEPLPLRLLARRLSGPYAGTVRLVGLEIALVGHTHVRVQDLHREEHTRWIVVSAGNLSVELFPARRRDGGSGGVGSSSSNGESSQSRNTSDNINAGKAGDNTPAATANGDGKGAGTAAEQQQDNNNNNDDAEEEFEIPAEGLWAHLPLPNTVAPSFRACNLERRYEIEVKLSLSWDGGSVGAASNTGSSSGGVWGWMKGSSGGEKPPPPQIIHLPLTLSRVEVFSGIRPPPQLLHGLSYPPPVPAPQIPPRPPGHPLHHPHPPHYQQQQQPQQQQQQHQPPQDPPYDDLPPSYDEAMAADITAPPVQARPAYSGVTAENDPSTLPGGGAEKS